MKSLTSFTVIIQPNQIYLTNTELTKPNPSKANTTIAKINNCFASEGS